MSAVIAAPLPGIGSAVEKGRKIFLHKQENYDGKDE
jgi:hypothetical protein